MMLATLMILMVLAIGFLAASAASVVTGVSYWRPNLVRRREEPITFWLSVATHAAIGAFVLARMASMIDR